MMGWREGSLQVAISSLCLAGLSHVDLLSNMPCTTAPFRLPEKLEAWRTRSPHGVKSHPMPMDFFSSKLLQPPSLGPWNRRLISTPNRAPFRKSEKMPSIPHAHGKMRREIICNAINGQLPELLARKLLRLSLGCFVCNSQPPGLVCISFDPKMVISTCPMESCPPRK